MGSNAHRHRLIEELRATTLTNGGKGCCVLISPNPYNPRMCLTNEACDWLIAAAERLGYSEPFGGWMSVVRAICDGALPDVLSEAIEAASILPLEPDESDTATP